MRFKSIQFVIVTLAIIATAFVLFILYPSSPIPPFDVETTFVVPALTKEYANDTYHFSLTMPDTFTARSIPSDENGETIALEDTAGNGIQIIISPFDEDLKELTNERIQTDVPDLAILDPQPVEIGANHTGLAFKSDNEAFGGASREVWFVFRGNLYQISRYSPRRISRTLLLSANPPTTSALSAIGRSKMPRALK